MNLSGFETFFAERRPFFVEGAGMFAFDLDCNDGSLQRPVLFAAHRPLAARLSRRSRRRQYARVPQQTKILGAAKLTGRAASSRSAR